MSIVVFLGPSLPVDEARRVLDATYLPPVAMGDVLAVVADRPRAIVIIDGVFERVPAVWHKEILYALAQGIPVFGASSMGALRAAECARFGMVGVGKVFEMFSGGVLEDDDEVAVAHAGAEHGFRCLSDAMVNLRFGLEQAAAAGAIGAATRDLLVAAAKQRFYAERSWSDLYAPRAGVSDAELDRLRGFVRALKPDLKRADALAVLRHVAAADLTPRAPTFFQQTDFWRMLLFREERIAGVSVARLARRVRATHPERADIMRGAARLWALSTMGVRLGGREVVELGALEELSDAVWSGTPNVDRFIAAELGRRGEPVTPFVDGPQASDEARAQAAAWYLGVFGDVPADERDDHAQGLRFASWDDLVDEVVAGLAARAS